MQSRGRAFSFTSAAIISEISHLLRQPAGVHRFSGLDPVSYTHLDVYKRQPSRNTAANSPLITRSAEWERRWKSLKLISIWRQMRRLSSPVPLSYPMAAIR